MERTHKNMQTARKCSAGGKTTLISRKEACWGGGVGKPEPERKKGLPMRGLNDQSCPHYLSSPINNLAWDLVFQKPKQGIERSRRCWERTKGRLERERLTYHWNMCELSSLDSNNPNTRGMEQRKLFKSDNQKASWCCEELTSKT